MHKLVLFVTSWRGDVTRVRKLYESIQKYNVDSIPFYIVVSQEDLPIFQKEVGTQNVNYIEEESINIYRGTFDGWRLQQVNKIMFATL
jgi:hypothetical protein